ncbi:MAG: Fe-S cluster assembly protein SufD [Ignavibacteriae bacterium]|nr:Fe-S cluster assembly protein SufD [Ignavibacteriota bacterium]
MSDNELHVLASYKSSFDRLEQSLNGEAASQLHTLRRRALTALEEKGFPTTKEEEWRFTNVAPIAAKSFVPVLHYSHEGVTRADAAKSLLSDPEAVQMVFINGHFSSELSSASIADGKVRVTNLATAFRTEFESVSRHLGKYVRHDENAFTAMNTAFVLDGAYVFVADNAQIEAPIHFLFIAAGNKSVMAAPRNLIIAGKNSKVSIIETYVGLTATPYLSNTVTEFVVGENARVEHDRLQDEHRDAFHISTVHFQQSTNSNVVSNAINLGGSIARNGITSVLAGEGIETTLNGLSLGTGTQHIDNHTTIDHAKPHCASHEIYKAVLDGKSRGVFNGKIFVRKDAQKTDAKQTNKTLLLSDEATIDTKPQLEIFADDVKCTHGATVGYLDDEQMFYLRSRGVGFEQARDILTFAFAIDVINRVHVDALRNRLEAMIHERLQEGRQLEK